MNQPIFDFSGPVAAIAFVATIAYGYFGIRNRACDPPYARASFVTAVVAVIIGLLILLHAVNPVVGYGLLCLALAGFELADLLRDERSRARMRRAALLSPRPSAELAPTLWVALAVAAGLMLLPYVILDVQRAAAAIVGACALLMAGTAWRIATAPRQIFGEDVRNERMRDRYSRTRKSGVTAVVAMGSIMVFMVGVNTQTHTTLPLLHTLQSVSWWTWALSGISLIVYCTYLGRQLSSVS